MVAQGHRKLGQGADPRIPQTHKKLVSHNIQQKKNLADATDVSKSFCCKTVKRAIY